jgi:hypothetical protein
VEIDGFIWHLLREEQDRAKGVALAAQGIRLLRVRDHRLGRLEPDDILFKQQEPFPDICIRVAKALARMCSGDDRRRLESYIQQGRMLGGEWFEEAMKALPGPPPGYSLADLHPAVAAEWDSKGNGHLCPDMMHPQAHFSARWACSTCGHGWRTTVNSRINGGTGCPACAGRVVTPERNLAVMFPELMDEWDQEGNLGLDPTRISPYSSQQVNWRCRDNPDHRWAAVVGNRTIGKTRCPDCLFISLRQHSPKIAAEWHPTWNGEETPGTVSYGSRTKWWWRCGECSWKWEATPNSRTSANGRGCPACARKVAVPGQSLADLCPQIAADLAPENIDPKTGERLLATDIQPGSNKNLFWRCSGGHLRQSVVQARIKSNGCPDCRRPYLTNPEDLPRTRAEARAAGIGYYFTGVPCQRAGHIAPRQVGNKNCIACNSDRSKERYLRRCEAA